MDEEDQPPSKLYPGKRAYNNNRNVPDYLPVVISTKLRQRAMVAGIWYPRPAKQQVCSQVARETT